MNSNFQICSSKQRRILLFSLLFSCKNRENRKADRFTSDGIHHQSFLPPVLPPGALSHIEISGRWPDRLARQISVERLACVCGPPCVTFFNRAFPPTRLFGSGLVWIRGSGWPGIVPFRLATRMGTWPHMPMRECLAPWRRRSAWGEAGIKVARPVPPARSGARAGWR